jgi:hypothetical protein
MRGQNVVERAWLWFSLGLALGLGVMSIAGGLRHALAAEGPDAAPPAPAAVEPARALVAQLEAQMRITESSLRRARELLTSLEGGNPSPQPVQDQGAGLRDGDGDDVVGIWRLVGVRGGKGGEFHKAPYEQYKIMTEDRYLWMSYDPDTGRVLRSGGGTYSLRDGTYTAHVDYSNSADLKAIAGQEYRFTCKIEGNQWYHAGPMPNGAYVDDLRERINLPR